jgi:steroid delta-isomerase-like uncharacterized protein
VSDQNKAIARRYFEQLLAGDLAVADEIVAEDVAFHGPNYWGEPIHGREGLKQFVRYLRSAFPDLRLAVREEVADETHVATRFELSGTHRGEWMGLAPTDRPIALPGMDLFRVADGRIAEVRVYYDTLGLMQQLGAVPAPPAPTAATP